MIFLEIVMKRKEKALTLIKTKIDFIQKLSQDIKKDIKY